MNKTTDINPLLVVGLDRKVIRHNDERCSYRCQYYQDGPVLSLCNKYHKQLRYDGKTPALLADECKAELTYNVAAKRSFDGSA